MIRLHLFVAPVIERWGCTALITVFCVVAIPFYLSCVLTVAEGVKR